MGSMRAESCPDFARNSQKSPQFMCLAPSTHWMAEIGRLISVALDVLPNDGGSVNFGLFHRPWSAFASASSVGGTYSYDELARYFDAEFAKEAPPSRCYKPSTVTCRLR